MRTTSLVVLGLAALGVLGACTTGNAPPPSLTKADAPVGCPLGVPGATVTAVDTPDGIALMFTSKDRPDEMRSRVNDAAAQHGSGTKMGQGHDGVHGHGGEHGLQIMQMPAARTVAEDIEGGARLRFAPSDPADLERLRAQVRERAVVISAANCK